MELQFTLVIPALNECLRLPPYLGACIDYLEGRFGDSYEILVIDDGSQDATYDCLDREFGAEHVAIVRHASNRGKGAAVRTGMLAARGHLRLFADADGATPINELDRLVAAITDGFDLAVGSRERSWSNRERRDVVRRCASRAFSRLARSVLGLTIQDTQCGFKLFRADAAQAIFQRATCDGYLFDVELLYLAQQLGYAVAEVPVLWKDMPGSKVRLAWDSWEMLCGLSKIRSVHESRRPLHHTALAHG
jgi:dolichyl-phosphate beta-glucosyltransferase